MTDLAQIQKVNGLTPLLSKLLDSQALSKHKATLALELEVLAKKFDRFGWDRDRGSMAQDRMILDWMEALQDYPLDEVRDACRQTVLSNPNKMPNEGHVRYQIMKARKKALAAMPAPVAPPQGPYAAPIERSDEQKREANALVSEFARRAGIEGGS